MNKHSGALARRYGTALFEILASASKSSADFEKNVQQIQLILSFCSKQTINYFSIASMSNEDKIVLLEHFLTSVVGPNQISGDIKSFLKVVLQNKRMSVIKPIFHFFLAKADEHLGIARATVISARPLGDNDVKEFESSLNEVLKKKVVFKSELDASLKSGFIVKLGHTNIDASFKARLNSLKELFI